MVKRNTYNSGKSNPRFDVGLLIVSALILLFGLIMLYEASGVVAYHNYGDSAYFVKKQLLGAVLGLAAFWVAYRIDYRFWQKWSFIILVISLIFLAVALTPWFGVDSGARRWIDLGFFGFQPSELVKLAIIFYMSAWLSERGPLTISSFKKGLLPFIFLMGVISLLILLQQDLGTLVIILAIGSIMYFLGGADLKHMAGLFVCGISFIALAIKIADYRVDRLKVFLDPSLSPLDLGYHINQALLAVGSGGLFGLGLGNSKQKYSYLPEVESDSIFAIIAEELGFVCSAVLIAAFLFILLRSVSIARRASDSFGRFLALGIGSWISIQAFVNIGTMVGILPMTGLTLPLISYGRSSLIVTMASIGVLLNISKRV